MKKWLRIGLDPGREFTKALMLTDAGDMRRAHFLSVVGHSQARTLGHVMGSSLDTNGRVIVEHVDRFGRPHRLDRMVGQEAVEQGVAPHVSRSRVRPPEVLRALTAEALLQLGVSDQRSVGLVMGAPVSYYADVATRRIIKGSWDALTVLETGHSRPTGASTTLDRLEDGARITVSGTVVQWAEQAKETIFYLQDRGVQTEVHIPGGNQLPNPTDKRITVQGEVQREGVYLDQLAGKWAVNGQEWTVEDVIVIPEGSGAIYSQALGVERGQVKDGSLLDNTVGVIDIGGYTTDVVLMQNKRYMEQQSFSVPVGVGRILESLRLHLSRRFGKDIPTYRLHNVLKQKYIMISKRYDLSTVIEEAALALFDLLNAQIQEKWEQVLLDQLILVGGGMHLLRPYFEQRYEMVYPSLDVDVEWANAKGFLTFAQWNAQWK